MINVYQFHVTKIAKLASNYLRMIMIKNAHRVKKDIYWTKITIVKRKKFLVMKVPFLMRKIMHAMNALIFARNMNKINVLVLLVIINITSIHQHKDVDLVQKYVIYLYQIHAFVSVVQLIMNYIIENV